MAKHDGKKNETEIKKEEEAEDKVQWEKKKNRQNKRNVNEEEASVLPIYSHPFQRHILNVIKVG